MTLLAGRRGLVLGVSGANSIGYRVAQMLHEHGAEGAVEHEDVARCIAYFCSPLASNVTGEIVTVDGGFSRAYL